MNTRHTKAACIGLFLGTLAACQGTPDASSRLADLPANDQNVAGAQTGFGQALSLGLGDLPTGAHGISAWSCTEYPAVQGYSTQTSFGLAFSAGTAADQPNLPATATAKLVFTTPPMTPGIVKATWLDQTNQQRSSHTFVMMPEGLVSEDFLIPDAAQGHVVDTIRRSADHSTYYIEHSVTPADIGQGAQAPAAIAPSPKAAGFEAESYSVCHVDDARTPAPPPPPQPPQDPTMQPVTAFDVGYNLFHYANKRTYSDSACSSAISGSHLPSPEQLNYLVHHNEIQYKSYSLVQWISSGGIWTNQMQGEQQTIFSVDMALNPNNGGAFTATVTRTYWYNLFENFYYVVCVLP